MFKKKLENKISSIRKQKIKKIIQRNEMFNLKFLLIVLSYFASIYVSCNNIENNKKNELTEAQLIFINRIRLSKYINNPYKYLNSSQGKNRQFFFV